MYDRYPKIPGIGREESLEDGIVEIPDGINQFRMKLPGIVREERGIDIAKEIGEEPNDLQIGKLVYKRRHFMEIQHKLDFKWNVPFKIVDLEGNGCYVLQDMHRNTKTANRRYLLKSNKMVSYLEKGDLWQLLNTSSLILYLKDKLFNNFVRSQ